MEGLKSVPCENYAQIERLMEQGTKIRTTASTNMNVSSSRSHMVITIQFKQVSWVNAVVPLSHQGWPLGRISSSTVSWWLLQNPFRLDLWIRCLPPTIDCRVRSKRKGDTCSFPTFSHIHAPRWLPAFRSMSLGDHQSPSTFGSTKIQSLKPDNPYNSLLIWIFDQLECTYLFHTPWWTSESDLYNVTSLIQKWSSISTGSVSTDSTNRGSKIRK